MNWQPTQEQVLAASRAYDLAYHKAHVEHRVHGMTAALIAAHALEPAMIITEDDLKTLRCIRADYALSGFLRAIGVLDRVIAALSPTGE